MQWSRSESISLQLMESAMVERHTALNDGQRLLFIATLIRSKHLLQGAAPAVVISMVS